MKLLFTFINNLKIYAIIALMGCNSDPTSSQIVPSEALDISYSILYKNQLDTPRFKPDNSWIYSVYYLSLFELWKVTEDPLILNSLLHWGNSNNWKIKKRNHNADDQLAGHVYYQLSVELNNNRYAVDIVNDIKAQINTNSLDTTWWWVDAIFMAPPLIESIDLNALNDSKQIFLDRQLALTKELLYSDIDSLYFRDKKFNNHEYRNGNKMFWLRGNGWAISGLIRLIDASNGSSYRINEYKNQFILFAEKLANLQSGDSLWNMELVDQNEFSIQETSGSALICYAITKAVNIDVLVKETYQETINNCWRGLTSKIQDDGTVVGVQPVGAKPSIFENTNTEPFGYGAMLLFLVEYHKYLVS